MVSLVTPRPGLTTFVVWVVCTIVVGVSFLVGIAGAYPRRTLEMDAEAIMPSVRPSSITVGPNLAVFPYVYAFQKPPTLPIQGDVSIAGAGSTRGIGVAAPFNLGRPSKVYQDRPHASTPAPAIPVEALPQSIYNEVHDSIKISPSGSSRGPIGRDGGRIGGDRSGAYGGPNSLPLQHYRNIGGYNGGGFGDHVSPVSARPRQFSSVGSRRSPRPRPPGPAAVTTTTSRSSSSPDSSSGGGRENDGVGINDASTSTAESMDP